MPLFLFCFPGDTVNVVPDYMFFLPDCFPTIVYVSKRVKNISPSLYCAINRRKIDESIIFYCNLEQQDLLSFDVFINHFDAVDTKISLVHVIGKREKFVKERMDAMYEYCTKQYSEPVFNCKLFDEDSFLNDFEDFLRRNAIELVVIPNKKRNIFTRLFNPSIAHRILFHTDIPMLVVPIK